MENLMKSMTLNNPGKLTLAVNQDEYDNLDILPEMTSDGVVVMSSLWHPSDEELGQLLDGGFVRLIILGESHPPVMLNVQEKAQ